MAAITATEQPEGRRLVFVGLVLLMFAGLIVQKLFWYQVADRETFVAMASSEHQDRRSLPARRGALLDRNGKPIAVNVTYDALYVFRPEIGNLDRTAAILSEALGMPREQIEARIRSADTHWTLVTAEVPTTASAAIERARLAGVRLQRSPLREYPEGSLAAQVLGFVGMDGTGLSGLELTLDHELGGRPGVVITESDTVGSEIALGRKAFIPPVAGSDVVLTLDRHVQRTAERILADAVKANKATGGVIIVMDPATGEILAMATSPTYSLTDGRGYDPAREALYKPVAVTDTYEPGSVMKLITMAAALEEEIVSPDNTWYQDNGVAYVAGVPIRNWDGGAYGRVSVREVLLKSLNTGTQWVASQLGSDRFYQYIDRFGFGTPTRIQLNGEAEGSFRRPGTAGWSVIDLATSSYGQSISVTALQMLTAIASLGNDGMLMRPQIVKEIRSPEGVRVTQPESVRQVVSPRTAATMLDMMVSHWTQSSFTQLQVPGYTFATKSGTADIPGPGGYSSGKTYASFAGFAPIPDPRFAILVRIDQPEALYGGTVAAPVFRDVAMELMYFYRIPPTVIRSSAR